MSDVKFNINYIQIAADDFQKASSDIKDCVYAFETIAHKVESELALFNGDGRKAVADIQKMTYDIRDIIQKIADKRKKALAQKQQEIQKPSPPSIPSDATPEAKQAIQSQYNEMVNMVNRQNEQIREANRKIDEYVVKCEKAMQELEGYISRIIKIIDSLKKRISEANSGTEHFFSIINQTNRNGQIVIGANDEFSSAMKKTIESAIKIHLLQPTQITSEAFIDRQFVIKNTHQHLVSSSSPFDFSGLGSFDSFNDTVEEKPKKPEKMEEIIIRERNFEDFCHSIDGVNSFAMPSANLHKLGGKKFNIEMEKLGYKLVTLPDGSTIDNRGMLHWEKRI